MVHAAATVGDVVHKPRVQWHTFVDAGDPARVLEVISPAGLERYFAELVRYFPVDAPPDLDGMIDANDRSDLGMDVDSPPGLVQRHSLAGPPELGGQTRPPSGSVRSAAAAQRSPEVARLQG